MRAESHRQLGRYLARHYLSDVPMACKRAFYIGCIQPDRNPITYLKGSIRCQWLRGHNYRNARRFLGQISRRLENKQNWSLWDYYTLGKLIHYTADAFTYAHNEAFCRHLGAHRAYEAALQDHFLAFLQEDPQVNNTAARTIMEAIYHHHRLYEDQESGIHTDARFALTACCCVLAVLITPV